MTEDLTAPVPVGFDSSCVDQAALTDGFALALLEAEEFELLELGRRGELRVRLDDFDADGWATAVLVRVGSGEPVGFDAQIHWSLVAAK
jgi:hypothetical protein